MSQSPERCVMVDDAAVGVAAAVARLATQETAHDPL